MSVQDDLTAVQRCIDDLTRTVGRLAEHVGRDGLEIRRVRTDAAHLRESIDLLREVHTADGGPGTKGGTHRRPTAAPHRPAPEPDVVRIPDTPYDSTLWTDADDEGLGALHRHGP
ncbi:hypothetical protein [Streptomyces sp. NPDC059816]|uniref:hypothetical protein n=1 Tax=Streptomyces sp. NPDC059816 TaxID=3346960 RepID=UPI003667EAE4